ncbi:hypothetical protein LOTGIDRAFT_159325 [Lottia gigantea]|uniref:Uncharacterized protein n=1 Tax=Lottia gigantea TaxID=225164 RepID=V4A0G4_LOTGI|nr:hypothetical protein LOTGIDRAFT_159325 [Lottia gigantea]ESO97303.1 hypothetical protein LOTGIDRAFT_159325 [Lottia gigantea]
MRNGIRVVQQVCLCPFKFFHKIRLMWLKSKLTSSINAFGSLSRSRKVIVAVLLLLILVYYLGASLFGHGGTTKRPNLSNGCLDEKVQTFFKQSLNYDAFINHNPLEEDEKPYPAYTGNGHLAAAFGTENGLFIRLNRALALPVNFYPVVNMNIDQSFVLDIKSGIVHKFQSFKQSWHCVQVESSLYAHRSRPSVLVQDISISNPTGDPVTVDFDQIGASGWTGAQTKTLQLRNGNEGVYNYRLSTGIVLVPDHPDLVVGAAIATRVITDTTLVIKPNSKHKQHIVTVVHYTKGMTKAEAESNIPELTKKVKKDMEEVMNINEKLLLREHVKVWEQLWKTGFSISDSKAQKAINGGKINTTIYYVLCNVPAPLHEITTTKQQRNEILKVLYYPDTCYAGHSTLQAETLWMDVVDEDHIARVVTTWMITLEKQGCSGIVQSGAEGVLQAMVLSFGALEFKNQHLELKRHPKELHRDIFFHRINYGNNTHVNISVIVGEDNKANLYVSLDRNDKPYYACDAGCVDAPIQLR